MGADQPRNTRHTKPLSPWAAILYPEAVRILTVACAETFAGAALLANVTSVSGVIRYLLSGGYWRFRPWTEVTCILKNKTKISQQWHGVFTLTSGRGTH